MAKLKLCPSCGGKHRKLKAAKACALRKKPAKWTKQELGL